jgi:hypothetical protein
MLRHQIEDKGYTRGLRRRHDGKTPPVISIEAEIKRLTGSGVQLRSNSGACALSFELSLIWRIVEETACQIALSALMRSIGFAMMPRTSLAIDWGNTTL